ncbi:hypothetical protein BDN70DRAFT_926075 [Pholiota conissans]|uniref:Transposase n=1 Tax=Pholiota conissans TaxID=109636 RepID=A0A9P6CMD7_9AGAR|nr:hypothetical protein BDN70DRAFT_926075 [Pholiota conissans]
MFMASTASLKHPAVAYLTAYSVDEKTQGGQTQSSSSAAGDIDAGAMVLMQDLSGTEPAVERQKLKTGEQRVKVHPAEHRCPRCRSEYYPDRYTYVLNNERTQALEYDTLYLRVSKRGVWIHRNIAKAQEHAVFRFRCGWSNFSGWLNDILQSKPGVTNRQAQRLFIEHFSRRLLREHAKENEFQLKVNATSLDFVAAICDIIGHNGGTVPSAFLHGCQECMHVKRFRSDLISEGATFDEGQAVAGLEENVGENTGQDNPHLPGAISQAEPIPGQKKGYVRMAVMDGKTIGHRTNMFSKICALNTCRNPLDNFKNGRFCVDHLNLRQICGIVPCGHPIASEGSVTCDDESHFQWHKRYIKRFNRLSYPGVRRVIRRQQNPPPGANPFNLNIEQQLPNLGDTPGNEVTHTFRARSVYCVETVQWACGIPIGWGKCYNSESAPQVLSIMSRIWQGREHLRPSFIAYDDACDLLRHIATQNNPSGWLNSTKFIVDAWHYIGHRATDILCRLWCNPAPTNGSQPDLIVVKQDSQGQTHSTRAFNTETAEHFNSWLTGFESQLSQMSDINFDFFMHSLFLLFKEDIEKRIQAKGQELSSEFWDENVGEKRANITLDTHAFLLSQWCTARFGHSFVLSAQD